MREFEIHRMILNSVNNADECHDGPTESVLEFFLSLGRSQEHTACLPPEPLLPDTAQPVVKK